MSREMGKWLSGEMVELGNSVFLPLKGFIYMVYFENLTCKLYQFIIPQTQDVITLGVKAGATVTNEYFKGIKKFFKIYNHTPWDGAVVYGRREPQLRADIKVITIWGIEEMLKNLEESIN